MKSKKATANSERSKNRWRKEQWGLSRQDEEGSVWFSQPHKQFTCYT